MPPSAASLQEQWLKTGEKTKKVKKGREERKQERGNEGKQTGGMGGFNRKRKGQKWGRWGIQRHFRIYLFGVSLQSAAKCLVEEGGILKAGQKKPNLAIPHTSLHLVSKVSHPWSEGNMKNLFSWC